MRTVLLTAALAAMFMLSGSASAESRGPYRHGVLGYHHRSYATATVPSYRTVRVERTTTIIKTSRQERKLMALAYMKKNGYLTVSKYCGFTGLDRQFAEAELDSFTLDRKDPLFRSMKGKKIVYTLTDE
mgnify:CR=1 FL=1